VSPHHEPLLIARSTEINVGIFSISKAAKSGRAQKVQKRGWEPGGYQEAFPLWILRWLLQDTSGKGQWKAKGVSTCHRMQA